MPGEQTINAVAREHPTSTGNGAQANAGSSADTTARAGVSPATSPGARAHREFQQMLARLVQAVVGQGAPLIHPDPGEWGVDVLLSNLDGRVRLWQAENFALGVDQPQRRQIATSFTGTIKAAQAHGYTVDEWILCIPCTMDAPARQWWGVWVRGRQWQTGVVIKLWDAAMLRRLLIGPEAKQARVALW